MDGQAIVPYVWTKLPDYDVEVFHDAGFTVIVWVEDDRLVSSAPGVASVLPSAPGHPRILLRPVGGRYPRGWRAPFAGVWAFGYSGGRGPYVHTEMSPAQVVLFDLAEADENSPGIGPVIAMDSHRPPITVTPLGQWDPRQSVVYRELPDGRVTG